MFGVRDRRLRFLRPLSDSRPLPAVPLQQLLLPGLCCSHDQVSNPSTAGVFFSSSTCSNLDLWMLDRLSAATTSRAPKTKPSPCTGCLLHGENLIDLIRLVFALPMKLRLLIFFFSSSPLSPFHLQCLRCEFSSQTADLMADHLLMNSEHHSATCRIRSKTAPPQLHP